MSVRAIRSSKLVKRGMRTSVLAALALALSVPSGYADSIWSIEVELGAVLTSGNTEEENLKFRTDSSRETDRFKQTIHGDTLRSSQAAATSAQRMYVHYKADYKFDDDRSLFARISYEDDRFSGFDYQPDLTAGYSRKLLGTDVHSLAADIGLGFRRSEAESGMREDEMIVRLEARYSWQVSDNAKFQQLLSLEAGNAATISRSETSLQTSAAGNLAMKLSLNVKNNSDVPVGREKTDTATSVTLVYSF